MLTFLLKSVDQGTMSLPRQETRRQHRHLWGGPGTNDCDAAGRIYELGDGLSSSRVKSVFERAWNPMALTAQVTPPRGFSWQKAEPEGNFDCSLRISSTGDRYGRN